MQDLAYKNRLSTLWSLFAISFLAYRTLALGDEATEVSLLANGEFTTYLVIAIGFALLTLILPSRLDRLTNLIAGTVFGVAQVAMLADGLTGYPDATFNLMTAATLVIMASIIWLAYRWPREANAEDIATGNADEPAKKELHRIG